MVGRVATCKRHPLRPGTQKVPLQTRESSGYQACTG